MVFFFFKRLDVRKKEFLRHSYYTEVELTTIIGVKNLTPSHVAKDSALEFINCFFIFLTGEKRSCQCTQGNMANLQKYKARKKDRSCKSKKTSTKILASYSSVSTSLHFPPAFVCLGFNSSASLSSHEGGKKTSDLFLETVFGNLIIS